MNNRPDTEELLAHIDEVIGPPKEETPEEKEVRKAALEEKANKAKRRKRLLQHSAER